MVCSHTAIYGSLHLYSFCWPKVLTKVCTGGPTYLRVIHSKTYRGYVKPRIILNAIYNVIHDIRETYINTVRFS